ncbi:MAG: rhodanese-like domain-containing protein, partial [Candidatus Puniceispirillaceae bacterium]
MGAPINRVESWTASDYDMIIDVRSPAEFADDHLPGAVNLPVLDNDQRAEIG